MKYLILAIVNFTMSIILAISSISYVAGTWFNCPSLLYYGGVTFLISLFISLILWFFQRKSASLNSVEEE